MIDVNEVYQTVLFILNKEQRGYITPAEFNSLAVQAQLTIFEKYFEDLNQALRMPLNDSEYASRVKSIEEKIDIFEVFGDLDATKSLSTLDPKVHRLGTIEYNAIGKLPVELEEMTKHDFNLAIRSQLTAPTFSFPAFFISGENIKTAPTSIAGTDLTVYYVKKPADPIWGYTIGGVGEFIYNKLPYDPTTEPYGSVNFEISSEDQVELVNTILTYCGIIIRDPQIIQAAAGMVGQENQNEKS